MLNGTKRFTLGRKYFYCFYTTLLSLNTSPRTLIFKEWPYPKCSVCIRFVSLLSFRSETVEATTMVNGTKDWQEAATIFIVFIRRLLSLNAASMTLIFKEWSSWKCRICIGFVSSLSLRLETVETTTMGKWHQKIYHGPQIFFIVFIQRLLSLNTPSRTLIFKEWPYPKCRVCIVFVGLLSFRIETVETTTMENGTKRFTLGRKYFYCFYTTFVKFEYIIKDTHIQIMTISKMPRLYWFRWLVKF